MTSNCCYTGIIPKDNQYSSVQAGLLSNCRQRTIDGCFRNITVDNLVVNSVLDAPLDSQTQSYGILNGIGTGFQITVGNPPTLLTGGVFAGSGVSNPTAAASQFQVPDDGRYEVQVTFSTTGYAGGGLGSIFIDGVQAGNVSITGAVAQENVTGFAYPFLTAGQVIDITVSLTGGAAVAITVPYFAVKIQYIGDV